MSLLVFFLLPTSGNTTVTIVLPTTIHHMSFVRCSIQRFVEHRLGSYRLAAHIILAIIVYPESP